MLCVNYRSFADYRCGSPLCYQMPTSDCYKTTGLTEHVLRNSELTLENQRSFFGGFHLIFILVGGIFN